MPAQYPYSYGNTLLKIENLCLDYGDNQILKNVNAEIKKIVRPGQIQGQMVGILGPSGRGKSQLFYLMGGLNQPTSGKVALNGFERKVKPGEVGMVLQNYPLLMHHSILNNLMLAANRKEKDSKVAQAKVMEMLSAFELADKYAMYPAQLSGGQRQRIAILQQILCSSHFLLLDEPFSGLDIIMENKVLQLIMKVASMDDLNTIILITHDVSAAVSVCDTIWLLGAEKESDGKMTPGSPRSSIKKTYDLIERGLCWDQWNDFAAVRPAVADFISEVKSEFVKL
jgi:polar amino acid transport system ATP-binding protein/sulfate transport system ATP-binding protein